MAAPHTEINGSSLACCQQARRSSQLGTYQRYLMRESILCVMIILKTENKNGLEKHWGKRTHIAYDRHIQGPEFNPLNPTSSLSLLSPELPQHHQAQILNQQLHITGSSSSGRGPRTPALLRVLPPQSYTTD